MKASNHGSGKGLEKQTSMLGLQKLQNVDGIRIFGEFWNAVQFSQMANNFEMIFGVVVVGHVLDLFDLGGLLWYHCYMLQGHQNIFRVGNFVFAMLWLEITPDNATTDPLVLEKI